MLELGHQAQIKEEIKKIEKLTKIFSYVRFILFALVVIFVICLISLDQFVLYLTLSIVLMCCFLAFVIGTNSYYHRQKLLKNLEYIYKKHENRRNLSYHSFTPDGRELIRYEDYKELDLDLLGPRSLFQYLCVAKSKEGKGKLAKQLTTPVVKEKKFTECVSALAKEEDSLRLEASISLIGSDAKDCDAQELFGILKKKIHIPWYGFLLCGLSYALLIAMLVIFTLKDIPLYYALLCLLLNFGIAKLCVRNDVFVFPSIKYGNLLTAYKRLSKDILEMQIEDPYFKEIQEVIHRKYASLSKLSQMIELLSYRKNILLSILGNGLFYLDYIVVGIFNAFAKSQDSIEECLDALSEVELMLSLATIGIDQEVYSIPVPATEFRMVDGYHPLVKSCIPNSISFNGGIVLTGSNMSGKTTFMRMLGVNQILANAGGLVCAKEFYTGKYTVVTSLRANDMLQEGISTFYAEVNRMKCIMEECQNPNTLVLIDEIFKGTNAKDRIYAAKEIIKKLQEKKVFFLITTHDFELCDTEGITNYHFDEEYINNQISFDYKIKNGKCQKTNAIYLLKLAGVLETAE